MIMKRLTLRNGGSKLGIRQIKTMEKQLGFELPEDYKNFLLKHNGGEVTGRSNFYYNKSSDPTYVTFFCLVDEHLAEPQEKADAYSISFQRYKFQEENPGVIPDNCLVVGKDYLGCLILLRTQGRRRGQVDYKMIDEWPEPEEDREQDVYRLAKTFSEFLDMLLDDDEVEFKDDDEQ